MDCDIERLFSFAALNAAGSQQAATPSVEASSLWKAPSMLSERNFSPRLAKRTFCSGSANRKTLSPRAGSPFRKGNRDSAETMTPQKPLVDAEGASTSATGVPFSVLD